MHVHSAQHVALADHLQVIHDLRIAGFRALHRPSPTRQRMRSARQYRQAMLRGGGRRVLAQAKELAPRFLDAAMRFGRDLDLSLQEFPPDMARRAEIGGLKERIRRLRRSFERLGVGQKVFFLDAELKLIARREGASLLAGSNEGADAKYSLLWVESEFHGFKVLGC